MRALPDPAGEQWCGPPVHVLASEQRPTTRDGKLRFQGAAAQRGYVQCSGHDVAQQLPTDTLQTILLNLGTPEAPANAVIGVGRQF